MDVTLPNGKVISGVPEDVGQKELATIAIKNGLADVRDFGSMFKVRRKVGRQFVNSFEEIKPDLVDNQVISAQEHEIGKAAAEQTDSANPKGLEAAKTRAYQDAIRQSRLTDQERMMVDGMGDGEALLVSIGKGFDDIINFASRDKRDEGENAAIAALKKSKPTTFAIGETIGQAAPLAPAGVATTGIKSLGGRLLANTAIGGVEGAAIAESSGQSALKGAGIGGGVAAGLELAIPYIGRIGGKIFRRLGREPEGPLVNPDGTPTPEFTEALEQANLPYEEVVQEAKREFTEEAAQEIPKDVAQEGAEQVTMKGVENVSRSAVQGDLRKLPSDVRPNQERIDLLDSFGLNDAPLGAVSDNPAFVSLAGGLASIPGSKLSLQQRDFIEKTSEAADNLIKEFGGRTDKSSLSEDLRTRFSRTRDDLVDQEAKLYDEVAESIGNPRVNAKPLKEYMEAQADALGGAKELGRLDREILRVAASNPTYKRLDKLRKDIGASIGRTANSPYSSESAGLLKDRYSKITELQEGVAKQFDGAAGKWDIAKGITQARKELEDNTVKLFGKDLAVAIMPKIGRSVKKLEKGDFTDFDRAMKLLPRPQQREVLATALDDIFRNPRGGFSPNSFNSWYKALSRNPAAKRRITSILPDNGKRLNDFFKATQGLAKLQQEHIPNGKIVSMLDSFDREGGMVSKIMNVGGKVAGAEGVGVAAGLPGVGTASVLTKEIMTKKTASKQLAEDLISDPAFIEAVKAHAKNKPDNVINIAEKRLAKSKAFTKWLASAPPETQSTLLSLGLIPWLIEDDE